MTARKKLYTEKCPKFAENLSFAITNIQGGPKKPALF